LDFTFEAFEAFEAFGAIEAFGRRVALCCILFIGCMERK